MPCQHDPSAFRDHLCCDCIIEQLYHHEIRSIRSIMRIEPLRTVANQRLMDAEQELSQAEIEEYYQ